MRCVLLALIAACALVVAVASLWRLSRLPTPLPEARDRTFATLAAGDVVLAEGDWLVVGREKLGAADLFALKAGRERRWLLAGEQGPVAFLTARPESGDVERAAALGGRKLDRATVELLPGAP